MEKVMGFLVDLETIIFKIFEIVKRIMTEVEGLQAKAEYVLHNYKKSPFWALFSFSGENFVKPNLNF